jgi:rubrerythrin
MSWGKPQIHTCQECGAQFESTAINVDDRCPTCRQAYKLKRARERHAARQTKKTELARQGRLYWCRASEIAQFNHFIDKNQRYTKCPICKRHMSVCRCCEPQVNHVRIARAKTWRPELLPLPKL